MQSGSSSASKPQAFNTVSTAGAAGMSSIIGTTRQRGRPPAAADRARPGADRARPHAAATPGCRRWRLSRDEMRPSASPSPGSLGLNFPAANLPIGRAIGSEACRGKSQKGQVPLCAGPHGRTLRGKHRNMPLLTRRIMKPYPSDDRPVHQ